MIVAIHQPNFFPWLGYFDKIRRADVFVFLDHVQFQKTGGTWSNRVKMMVNGEPRWVTAPVARAGHGVKAINEIRFNEASPWRTKLLKTLKASYGKAPFFSEAIELLEPLILRAESGMALYNIEAVTAIADALGMGRRKFIRSSTLALTDHGTQLLIAITQRTGGDAYLCGDGAGGYQDDEAFAKAGLALAYQNFLPSVYPQIGASAFVPGLSVIDALMNCGLEGTKKLLCSDKAELRAESTSGLKAEAPPTIGAALQQRFEFRAPAESFVTQIASELERLDEETLRQEAVERLSAEWRQRVRVAAGLPAAIEGTPTIAESMQEVSFLRANQVALRPAFAALAARRVLYSGQAYYNAWYLSRALRARGWKADVMNWDMAPASQIYYHGEDISFDGQSPLLTEQMLQFYVSSLYAYDVFHFSNAHGIGFGWPVENVFEQHFSRHAEISLLKELGKKIVYSNNGCLDGVSQTAFSKWGPESVCSICRWRTEPNVCSDEKNLAWGRFRNSVADYQCLLGGNRVDFNDDPRIHETPEFYCLDPEVWHPQMQIPEPFRLPPTPKGTVWLYHAVGNKAERTAADGVNIKSSHVYLPLIEKLKEQGLLLELLEPTGIPNREVRYLQAQADIFLDMLTYGWFGATAREAMMLGKPVVCHIRPEWLESVAKEIPDYAAELPIVNATPATVEEVLRDLAAHPEKRREIGRKGRAFAMKWHSAEAGGRRFDEIYRKLLRGQPLLRVPV